MSILAYTLHQIIRNKEKLPLNAVVEFSAKDDPEGLVKVGAIREPTAQEIALYELANPKAADLESEKPIEPEKPVEPKRPKGGKKAEQSVDPEVTDPLV